MSNEEVLEKIKKLLRLGQSPNKHEAELAVQRAFELASRYQIDIESVSLEEEIRKIVAEKLPCGGRLSLARKLILGLLSGYFNVSVVINRVPSWARGIDQPGITFIGKTVDIAIAKYVYEFLYEACAQALKEFCREKRRRPARSTQQSFVQGFMYGVISKLRAAKEQIPAAEHALVVNERARREQKKQEMFNPENLRPVNTENTARKNRDALWDGYEQGQKVNIRKPIATNAAGQRLLGI